MTRIYYCFKTITQMRSDAINSAFRNSKFKRKVDETILYCCIKFSFEKKCYL